MLAGVTYPEFRLTISTIVLSTFALIIIRSLVEFKNNAAKSDILIDQASAQAEVKEIDEGGLKLFHTDLIAHFKAPNKTWLFEQITPLRLG